MREFPTHKEIIRCPECGFMQEATVEHTDPWYSYIHFCEKCGYSITESEWATIKDLTMKKINAIIIDGKAYEVVQAKFPICDNCAIKKECDQVTRDYCLVDALFGINGNRILRFSKELTDKINKL